MDVKQFYEDLLIEYIKPGGYINSSSQLYNNKNNYVPYKQAEIIKGFSISDTSSLEVKLTDVLFNDNNLFSQNCFTYDCFSEVGISTYITNISNLVQVQHNNKIFFIEEEKALLKNYNYFLDEGRKSYFVRGTPDIYGNIYLIDIGILSPVTNEIKFIEYNVSFYNIGEKEVLYAKSILNTEIGIKVVRIKKVSKTKQEIIGIVYGQTLNNTYLLNNTLNYKKDYTYQNQKINLEDLVLNLLILTNNKISKFRPNQLLYRYDDLSMPEIENIVFTNTNLLVNLINKDDSELQGSVPLNIASYLINDDDYNSNKDVDYKNNIISCLKSDCLDFLCNEAFLNKLLINRSVDNRSLAWLLIYFTDVSINYNYDLNLVINNIASYLLKQKDFYSRLYYKGWDDVEPNKSSIYLENDFELFTEDSKDLSLEFINLSEKEYKNALKQNKEIKTSTNIAILLSLFKLFDYTADYNYIVEASDLYDSINKYLLTEDSFIKHSLSKVDTSLESLSYYLLLKSFIQDYNNFDKISNLLNSRLFITEVAIQNNVQVDSNIVLKDTDEVFIKQSEFIALSEAEFSLFYPYPNDELENTTDKLKYNYFLISVLSNFQDTIFNNVVLDKYSKLQNQLVKNNKNLSLTYLLSEYIDRKSILNFNNIEFKGLAYFYNYRFLKDLLYNNLIKITPTDYDWFNPILFKGTSVLSQIYKSIAKVFSSIEGEILFINELNFLENNYGNLLNKKGIEYNIFRRIKESDESYKNRIIELLTKSSFEKYTVSYIKSYLRELKAEVNITDNIEAVIAPENFLTSDFNTNWNQGYLQGKNTYNTNIFTYSLQQPVDSELYQELIRLKPDATKEYIVEIYTYKTNTTYTLLNLKDVLYEEGEINCDNLDLETSFDLLSEVNARFCLEDELISTPIEPEICVSKLQINDQLHITNELHILDDNCGIEPEICVPKLQINNQLHIINQLQILDDNCGIEPPLPPLLRICIYSIKLFDSYGDGWNNALINVLVNNSIVLENITISDSNGFESEMFLFEGLEGDYITTSITSLGSYPEECSYKIYDNLGQVIYTKNSPLSVIPDNILVMTYNEPA